MKICIILNHPTTPENIGAAARALKTMGFSDLRLVDPCDHLSDRAHWLAHGSEDILESAQVFNSITAAISDIDFLIGTSAKKRPSKNENIPARKLTQLLQNKGTTIQSVGILFGTEDRGLSNEQLAVCDILSHIPIKQAQPSLNLAQAVMIYAYELSPILQNKSRQTAPKPTEQAYRKLKQNVIDVLVELGLDNRMPIHNRIIERLALLGEKDTHLIQSILTTLAKKNQSD